MKKLSKILVLMLAFWLAFFNPVNISLIYAQQATPTDTPADTPTPADTSTPDPTATPTDTPTSTDSPTPVPADTTSPSPTDSPAPTTDPSLTTGNATSAADSLTGSNISDISATPDPEATDSATPDPDATPSATPTPDPSNISVDQSGTTTTDTTSSSDTGNNSQQSPGGSATMATGNAGSVSNSVTVTNLSEVNSNLITAVVNILNSSTENIDLYTALEEAIANNPNLVPANTNITVNQTAGTTTNTQSSANSGGNAQTAGSTAMTTGDAVALANAINAVNLNLVGSNTVLTIINILADWNGNIILPNGTQLSTASLTGGGTTVNATQDASATTNTASTAGSGGNTQTGGTAVMTTGNSASAANSANLVNVIEIGNGLGYLIINNSGNWTGSLLNWSAPGSSQTLGTGSYNLLANYGGSSSGSGGGGNTTITSNQTANVNTNVTSSAATGGNSQNGRSTSLVTGNALSLANNFTLANLTSVGGGFFFGIINILGNWTGSIITAYPELKVAVTDNTDSVGPGGAENYIVTITNAGHAIAHGVALNFTFPGEVNPDGNQNTSWNLGSLNPGQTQTFDLSGHVSGGAAGGMELLASATGSTSDTQDSTSGDTGTDSTNVVLPADRGLNTQTPGLETDIWDSVGAFIYPGDTFWATITVHNNSPVFARNLVVNGDIKDPNGNIITPLNWQVGDVKPSGKVKVSFNVTIPKDSVAGKYIFEASATGQSESGDFSTSNLAQSAFLVNSPAGTGKFVTPPVFGTTTGQSPGGTPEVLGASIQGSPINLNNIALYTFPLLAALYFLIVAGRRRLLGEPLVSPAFAEFFKKRKAFLAGGLSILIIAIGIFIRKRI